jgi:hypothetical protein
VQAPDRGVVIGFCGQHPAFRLGELGAGVARPVQQLLADRHSGPPSNPDGIIVYID